MEFRKKKIIYLAQNIKGKKKNILVYDVLLMYVLKFYDYI